MNELLRIFQLFYIFLLAIVLDRDSYGNIIIQLNLSIDRYIGIAHV